MVGMEKSVFDILIKQMPGLPRTSAEMGMRWHFRSRSSALRSAVDSICASCPHLCSCCVRLAQPSMESSYKFVLRRLLELRPKLSPTSIALDFEKAETNAFKKVFPADEKSKKKAIEPRTCFFHKQQALYRNVCTKGYKDLYDTDQEFRKQVNLMSAIAFVPVVDVEAAFDWLRYDHAIWNLRSLIETDEPTTSNGIESFNGQMLRTLAASHPTIWKLIEGLRLELKMAEQKMRAYRTGENTPWFCFEI
uniref:MULE transposase domain-containing protein n=1 Tax=Ditylenchus dipsaci TaxID=166011 RepID=A0A915DSM5_9BILA